jgi:hypothetical protein
MLQENIYQKKKKKRRKRKKIITRGDETLPQRNKLNYKIKWYGIVGVLAYPIKSHPQV